jgi:hypothetical protein
MPITRTPGRAHSTSQVPVTETTNPTPKVAPDEQVSRQADDTLTDPQKSSLVLKPLYFRPKQLTQFRNSGESSARGSKPIALFHKASNSDLKREESGTVRDSAKFTAVLTRLDNIQRVDRKRSIFVE